MVGRLLSHVQLRQLKVNLPTELLKESLSEFGLADFQHLHQKVKLRRKGVCTGVPLIPDRSTRVLDNVALIRKYVLESWDVFSLQDSLVLAMQCLMTNEGKL